MRKFISIVLIASIFLSMFVTASAVSNANNYGIYVDVSGWSGFNNLYCHIWVNKGESYFEWDDVNTLCTKVKDDLYFFDLVNLERSTKIDEPLQENVSYGINFHTDAIDDSGNLYQTYDMTMDSRCAGDTVRLTGNLLEHPMTSENTLYEAKWEQNSDRCGSHFAITSTGNFVGDYFYSNEDAVDVTGHWIRYNFNSDTCDPVTTLAKAIEKFNIYDVDMISEVVAEYGADEEDFVVIYKQLDDAYNIAYNVEVLHQCGDYKYRILKDGTAEIAEYISVNPIVEIPSTLDGLTVSSIGYYSFGECGYITELIIPETVTAIKPFAFEECYGFTNISIPAGIENIGIGVFKNCKALTEINVDSNNAKYTSIDGVLFNKECTELLSYPLAKQGEYIVPDGVKTIKNSAFFGCDNITKISMPDSVLNIESLVFANCSKLTEIVFSKNIENVGISAFDNTVWYTNKPEGVVVIGKVAYKYKTSTSENSNSGSSSSVITSGKLVISSEVVYIAESAFAFNNRIKTLVIPSNVKSIEDSAFYNCKKLENVTFKEGLEIVKQSAFEECNKLTYVKIPKSVKTIKTRAFGYKFLHNEKNHSDEYKLIDNFNIRGYKGTVAQSYARKNKIPFVDLKNKPKLKISSKSLKAGKVLTNKVLNASAFKIEWVSSNKKIATVSQKGVITAISRGSAKVTAKIKGYGNVTCKIKVTSSPKITKSGKKISTITVKKGKSKVVSLSGRNSKIKNKYSSQKPKIAKITSKKTASKLNIKGYKKGTTKIYVTVNGSYKIALKVIVK